MSDPITAWLDEAQQRADAATEGPWHGYGLDPNGAYFVHGGTEAVGYFAADPIVTEGAIEEDAEFIAHARTDLPRALAALRAVLGLHKPFHVHGRLGTCGHCGSPSYPCPTVRAISDALGVAP